MAYEHLILEDKGFIRVISISRPKVLNALNKKLLHELDAVINETKNHKDIRVVILTGSGEKSFVAGADVTEMKTMSPMEAEAFSYLGQSVMDQIENFRIPVIAAVNGYALGGGLELALASDFIYASENSSFGLVETKLGLTPGFGGTARLAKRVGKAFAKEMIYSACQINAHEALRIGLVNRVCSEGEVLIAAKNLAQKIGEKGPLAVSLCKSVLKDADHLSNDIMNSMERANFALTFSSKDHEEGISAFLEKRNPNYIGE